MNGRSLFVSASAAAIALCTLSSCTSQPDTVEVFSFPAQFAEERPQQPLVALDAFRDDERFYIRYRIGEEIRYTGGEWANRIDLKSVVAAEGAQGPFIVPLQYHQSERWTGVPDDTVAARVLSVELWQQFRDAFVASLMQQDRRQGVVLQFETDDYFLYSDAAGDFHSVPLDDKPADVEIGRRVSFGDLVQQGVPQLRDFLDENGILDDRVIFNTGDTGTYSLPFLYVNLELPLAAFNRVEPATEPC